MQHMGLFVSLSIWILFILTTVLILIAVELGFRWDRRRHRSDAEREAPVETMVGELLGRAAFLLALTEVWPTALDC